MLCLVVQHFFLCVVYLREREGKQSKGGGYNIRYDMFVETIGGFKTLVISRRHDIYYDISLFNLKHMTNALQVKEPILCFNLHENNNIIQLLKYVL